MSSNRQSASALAATRALVSRDVGFVAGLFTRLFLDQAAGREDATWLTMTYTDLLALVVYEVRQLPKKGVTIEGADAPITYEKTLNESRHSTKLLDDTKLTIEQQLEALRQYSARHRDQLIDMTRAPELLRTVPFFGALQDDTSVLVSNGEIIATSQSIRHHAGLEMDADGQVIQERSREQGAFLRSVENEASAAWELLTSSANWSFPTVQALDTKYAEFFGSTFPGLPLGESMALSLVSCRLRAALVLGSCAREAGEGVRALAFKFRFVAIWQVASTLRTIAAGGTSFSLDHEREAELSHVQTAACLVAMAEAGFRELRNVLVHYRVTRRQSPFIDWHEPLLGLPQALCKRSWAEIDDLTDEVALLLLEMLDRWRGPFLHLLREP